MRIYTVYDKIAEESGPLFIQKSDSTARRAFRSMIKDEKLRREEYELRYLGDYDTEKSVIQARKTPYTIDLIYEEEEVKNEK